jgi:hypothetical protein
MKTQGVKNWKSLLTIIIVILFVSCQKSDDIGYNDVTGTYVGTLTSNLANKSSEIVVTKDATVVVSSVGNQIQVNCYAEDFDTTFMLGTYDNNDEVMVCLTGEEFENMYGHMLGQGHMNGNMQNNGTEWMQHLNNEHQEGDEHFGGFDMQRHSFNYTFRMSNGDFHFQGIKN